MAYKYIYKDNNNEIWIRNISGIISSIVAFCIVVIIWYVMITEVTWNGSKKGGWRYFNAGIALVLFSGIGAFIGYQITYGILHVIQNRKK